MGENASVSFSRRLQFVAAQIGRKPDTALVLAMLVEPNDLPGERWAVIDQRTWRTGQTPNPSEAAIRAREAGSVTAWRSFEQKGASRWLWVQVTPTVSEEDARAFIADMPNRFLKNLHAKAVVTSEHAVEDVEIPGADDVWCFEQATTGKDGDSIAMYAAGRVGPLVFAVAASSLDGGWDWQAVTAVVAKQAERLSEPDEDAAVTR